MLDRIVKLYKFIGNNFSIPNKDFSPGPIDVIKRDGKIGLKFHTHEYCYNITDVGEKLPFDYIECVENDYDKVGIYIYNNQRGTNNLKNLEGLSPLPDNTSSNLLCIYLCSLDKLTSLRGCPERVQNFSITDCNNIKDMEYMPNEISYYFELNNVPVKKLKPVNIGCEMTLRKIVPEFSFEGITLKATNSKIKIYESDMLDLSYFPKCESVFFGDCTFSNIDGLENNVEEITYELHTFHDIDAFRKYIGRTHLWRRKCY